MNWGGLLLSPAPPCGLLTSGGSFAKIRVSKPRFLELEGYQLLLQLLQPPVELLRLHRNPVLPRSSMFNSCPFVSQAIANNRADITCYLNLISGAVQKRRHVFEKTGSMVANHLLRCSIW